MATFHAVPHFANEVDMYRSKAFVEAVVLLQIKAPALHSILSGCLTVIGTEKVPTAGTDGFYVYINPGFFVGLKSTELRVALLYHEIMHCVFRHPLRGLEFGKRGVGPGGTAWDPFTYNVAGDYVINDDIRKAGLPVGDNWLVHSTFGRDDLVDAVYRELVEAKPQPQPQPQPSDESNTDDEGEDMDGDSPDETDGSGGEAEAEGDADAEGDGSGEAEGDADAEGDGSGEAEGDGSGEAEGSGEGEGEGSGEADGPTNDATGHADGVGTDSGHDVHLAPQYTGNPDEQKAQAEDDDKTMAKAIDDAVDAADKAVEAGDADRTGTPSEAFRSAGHRAKHASQLDWRTELQDLLQRTGQSGEADWSRISRRTRRDMVLNASGVAPISPSRKGTVNLLALTIDISSSVNQDQLREFLVECAQAIDVVQPQQVIVLWTNTRVTAVSEVTTGDELLSLDWRCCGGTQMSEGALWLEANGYSPDIHLCFTDGELGGDDYHLCAQHEVIIVLDKPLDKIYSHYSRYLKASGVRYLVACDPEG